jgi:hypothetical protein
VVTLTWNIHRNAVKIKRLPKDKDDKKYWYAAALKFGR